LSYWILAHIPKANDINLRVTFLAGGGLEKMNLLKRNEKTIT